MDPTTKLCAWAFVIQYKNKKYINSNHRTLKTVSNNGELLAVVKALGHAKSFDDKKITVFISNEPIVNICRDFEHQKPYKEIIKKICDDDKALYYNLYTYFSYYTLSVKKISRDNNPAHSEAIAELRKAKKAVRFNPI